MGTIDVFPLQSGGIAPFARATVVRPAEEPSAEKSLPADAVAPEQPASDVNFARSEDAAKAFEQALNDRLERLFQSNLRLRIDTDQGTGAFVYQSIDRRTGEVQKQWPPETILQLMAFLRELDGLLVDAKA